MGRQFLRTGLPPVDAPGDHIGATTLIPSSATLPFFHGLFPTGVIQPYSIPQLRQRYDTIQGMK